MVADPLIPLAVWTDTGEDVKASLKPIVPALGDLHGFVFLMVGGIGAIGGCLAANGGEVTVQLDHGVAGRDCIGAVDLHFIVPLRDNCDANGKKREDAVEGQVSILFPRALAQAVKVPSEAVTLEVSAVN